MKILSISPYLPSEVTGHAGPQLIYRNLVQLAKDHTVHVICFINPDEVDQVRMLQSVGIQVSYIPFARNLTTLLAKSIYQRYLRFKAILSASIFFEPMFVAKYRQNAMFKTVDKVLASFQPDIVHIEYNIMHHYADVIKTHPIVLTAHDISAKVHERKYSVAKARIERLRFWLSYLKWQFREPIILRKFSALITLTQEDREYCNRWKNLPPIYVVPPAISVKPLGVIEKDPISLVFIGSFNRIPNRAALDIILNKLWPSINSTYPEAKLKIAGKYMPTLLEELISSSPNVVHSGFVPQIDSFLATSSLFIAPIFVGAGLKMKITHALACGTPVLTTSVGAEGIPLTEKEGLWVVNDIPSMTKKCIELLAQPEQLKEIGQRARKKVHEIFAPEVIESQLTAIYQRLVKKHESHSIHTK